MRRRRSLAFVLCALTLGCSDDGQPVDRGVSGEAKPLDAKQGGEKANPTDQSGAFPEARPADQVGWKCTVGDPNMCDGFKTQQCVNGFCTPCPANKTDCDRKGDCECAGVCDGTKCKSS